MNDTKEQKLEKLSSVFKFSLEKDLKDEISTDGFIKAFKKDTEIIDIGQYIKSIPIVLEGNIKIYREDDDGNELFLYYLYPGDACAISLVCSINSKVSEIRAVASEDTEVLMIPLEKMDRYMLNYRTWYQFVLSTYGKRLNELLQTIDSIAFHKMDERLLEYLQKVASATGSTLIEGTHQSIAYELNSSREVISRLLKQMEKKGLVELMRNKIQLLEE